MWLSWLTQAVMNAHDGVGGASMTHVNGGRNLAWPCDAMGGWKLSHPSDRQHWAQHSLTSQTVLNSGWRNSLLQYIIGQRQNTGHQRKLQGVKVVLGTSRSRLQQPIDAGKKPG